jgi:hypothetical protein
MSDIAKGDIGKAMVDVCRDTVPNLLHEEYLHYVLPLESLDGFETAISGTGSVSLTLDGVLLTTGTTANSTAYAGKLLFRLGANMFNYKLRALLLIATYYGDANLLAYFGVGDVRDATQFIGFKIDGGKLYGCAISGGTETLVDLNYSVPGGLPAVLPPLEVVFYPSLKAEFYVNMVKRGELTSGLPTGNPSFRRILNLKVQNLDTTNRGISLGYFSLLRWIV